MAELQTKMKTDQIVDEENEKFLDYTIKVSQHDRINTSTFGKHINQQTIILFSKELEKQIEYWECKYKTDTKEIDEQLENLIITLAEKSKEIESLKKTVRTIFILYFACVSRYFVSNRCDYRNGVDVRLDFNSTIFNAIYTPHIRISKQF